MGRQALGCKFVLACRLGSSTRRRSLRAAHSGAIWIAVRGLQKGNPNILIKGNPVACAVLFGLGPAHCAFCTGYDFLGRVCGEGVMPYASPSPVPVQMGWTQSWCS